MNRTLKTLALFLLVSTVSFVYAQDEDAKYGDKAKTSDTGKDGKAGTVDINKGLIGKDKPPSVTNTPMNQADKNKLRDGKGDQEAKQGKRGSFWSRLFGGNKVKKEEDPN
jgi:hypothetical protein